MHEQIQFSSGLLSSKRRLKKNNFHQLNSISSETLYNVKVGKNSFPGKVQTGHSLDDIQIFWINQYWVFAWKYNSVGEIKTSAIFCLPFSSSDDDCWQQGGRVWKLPSPLYWQAVGHFCFLPSRVLLCVLAIQWQHYPTLYSSISFSFNHMFVTCFFSGMMRLINRFEVLKKMAFSPTTILP